MCTYIKHRSKIILTFVLAFLFAFTVTFQDNAYADDAAAKIGDTEYATLSEAITAATASDKIVMQRNVTENITIESGKTITLDLNGYTLTNNGSNDTITNKGTLVIIDSSTAKSGKVDNVNNGHGALVNYPDAVATLSGGTFVRSQESGSSGTTKNSWYVIKNMGTLTINAGTTVKEESNYSSLIDNGWYNASNPSANDRSQSSSGKTATLTINGGTFTGGLNTIKNDDLGVLTINGGAFEDHCQAIVQNNNVATINGGTFDGSHLYEDHSSEHDHALFENKPSDGSTDKGVLTINGGTFIAGDSEVSVITYVKSDSSLTADQVVITGGNFTVGDSTLFNNTGSVSPTIDTYGGTYDTPIPSEYLGDGVVNITSDGSTFNLASTSDNAVASVELSDGTTVYFTNRSAAESYASTNSLTTTDLKYVVTVHPGNGDASYTVLVSNGDKLASIDAPGYDGYTFTGWYTDKDLTTVYDFDSTVSSDFDLYAGWVENEVAKAAKDASGKASSAANTIQSKLKSASTGDTSNINIWIIVAIIAVAVIGASAGYGIYKKRHSQR